MADTADPRERVILPARRYVLMIEVRLPVGGFSSSAIEERLKAQLPDMDPIVWGCIDGVDGAYRNTRPWPVAGVEWCVTHHGIVDEISDRWGPDGAYCDHHDVDDAPCDIRPLFHGSAW